MIVTQMMVRHNFRLLSYLLVFLVIGCGAPESVEMSAPEASAPTNPMVVSEELVASADDEPLSVGIETMVADEDPMPVVAEVAAENVPAIMPGTATTQAKPAQKVNQYAPAKKVRKTTPAKAKRQYSASPRGLNSNTVGLGAILSPKKQTPAHQLLEKYPTIQSLSRVKPKQQVTVSVSLSDVLITPDVGVSIVDSDRVSIGDNGQLKLQLPTNDKDQWTMGVALTAPGFEIEGDAVGQIVVPKIGRSSVAYFKMRARDVSETTAKRFYVTFYHNGTYLARTTKPIVIEPDNAAVEPRDVVVDTTPAKRLSFDIMRKPVDLTVIIHQGINDQNPNESQIIVVSPYFELSSDKFYRTPDLTKKLNQRFAEITQGVQRGFSLVKKDKSIPRKSIFIPKMKSFGKDLYQHDAPELFKTAFWFLHDKLGDDFNTIQIRTNDTTLPWELMRPVKLGKPEQDFLGIGFEMARWHVGEGGFILDTPPQSVSMKSRHIIAPHYQQEHTLPWQQKEVTTLKSQGFKSLPAKFNALKRYFSKLHGGIVHFVGHGFVKTQDNGETQYSILLDDIELDVNTWKGLNARSQKGQFFFFNACQVGTVSKVANQINGWAPAILESGASGYVSTLWYVGDESASNFGIEFYQGLGLKQSSPILVAKQLQSIRQRFYETGDPTYLAYVFYGSPNLTLVSE